MVGGGGWCGDFSQQRATATTTAGLPLWLLIAFGRLKLQHFLGELREDELDVLVLFSRGFNEQATRPLGSQFFALLSGDHSICLEVAFIRH